MADFNKPATTDTYVNYTSYLNAKIQDLALGLDPANTSPTNVPTNAVRWNSANNRFEKYDGTTWNVLSATFAVGALTATSTATATAFIPTGSTAPANGMYLPAANTLAFASNSSERWRVDSSGNFVIGATSPAASKFRVVGSDSVAIGLINGASYGVRFGSTAAIGANIDAVDITGTGSYQPMYLGGSTLGLQTGGTTRATIDASGNFGIGGTPYVKLDVYGNAAFRGSSTRFRLYNTANGTDATLAFGADSGLVWLGAETSSALYFVTNNSERMRLDASGNLGLGVTPSAWSSSYKAFQFAARGVLANDSTDAGVISFGSNYYRDSGTNYVYLASSFATRYTQYAGQHQWYTATTGTAGTNISFTQAMTLDASGNLGVGTTSPNQTGFTAPVLSITNGTSGIVELIGTQASNGTVGQIAFYNTSSSVRIAQILGVRSGANNSGALTFQTNNAGTLGEVGRFDSSGNLLVGGTASPGGSGSIFAGTNVYIGTTNGDPTNNRVTGMQARSDGAIYARASGSWDLGRSTTSGIHITFYTDNGSARVTAGNISSNGSTTSYGTGSDYRMKENIQPMTGALAKVTQLKPVTYDWKDEFSGTKKEGQGFIAHELQAVVPDAVVGEKDAVDANGKPVYQGIDTSFLVATLTAAIQEQQAIIVQLQSDVAALKH